MGHFLLTKNGFAAPHPLYPTEDFINFPFSKKSIFQKLFQANVSLFGMFQGLLFEDILAMRNLLCCFCTAYISVNICANIFRNICGIFSDRKKTCKYLRHNKRKKMAPAESYGSYMQPCSICQILIDSIFYRY